MEAKKTELTTDTIKQEKNYMKKSNEYEKQSKTQNATK